SDLEGYIKIHEEIELPVAMHVGSGPQIIRAVKAEVVDCFNLGGSLVGFQKNAATALAAGFSCWHGSGNDLGIVDTSYVHAAAAAPNCTMASDFVGSWTREDDLIVEPIPFNDGYVPTPEKPGLGCELDEVALGRYIVGHETASA
ncbi:MAG: enolase C-terminal domain-like protein, partial [Candidatus Latescibacteria bacterium]|nr:enolase C-terminal domain-like protein [Candidatus Latescibacterota bacterium]